MRISFTFRRTFVYAALIACISTLPNRMSAQAQDPLEDIGIRPLTVELPIESGSINSGNGNVHLEFSLGTFPQRGGGQVTAALVYDSAVWSQLQCCVWAPVDTLFNYGNLQHHHLLGWHVKTTVQAGQVQYPYKAIYRCAADGIDEWGDYGRPFTWTDPNGAIHAFPIQTVKGNITQCGDFTNKDVPSGNAIAADGSGYYMYVTNFTTVVVYGPDGTQVYQEPNLLSYANPVDSNGNYYSHTSPWYGASNDDVIDTLGRQVFKYTISGTAITFTVLNASGTTSTYTANIGPVSVSTNFASSGSSYTDFSSTAYEVITSLNLPDGTSYSFGYDSGTTAGHYGQVTSMILPTGGQISYQYINFADSMGITPGKHMSRGINTRTTPDGTWTYTPKVVLQCTGSGSGNCQQQLTVAKPNGDTSVYTVLINGGVWPIKAQFYTGATTLLATINQAFNFYACPSLGAGWSGQCYISKASESLVLPLPNGATVTRTTQYTWDTATHNGNLLTKAEWNFYSGTQPATADRTTNLSYVNGASYLSKTITNLVSSETVTDSSGSTVSQILNCYDYTGSCGGTSFSSVTGATHHDDTNYSTTNTVRGDLTQVQTLIGGTSYLTTSSIFDTTGQVLSSTDSAGNVTSYSYSDSFYNDIGDASNPSAYTPPQLTNAYRTSIMQGSLVWSTGYYWGTGQAALSKDPNSQTSYYHFYDSLDRSTSTKYPDGGWVYNQYPASSQTQVDKYIGIGSATVSASCTSCRHDETLLDTLGRQSSQLMVNDPDGQTTTAYTYDNDGREFSSTTPYRNVSETTYGTEQASYDGLDRSVQVKRADGSIAHSYYGSDVGVGGGTATPLCASSTYGLGFPILRVDEAGKKRQIWVDGFGRPIEADEPDAAGTMNVATCYKYDLNNNLTSVGQGSETRTFNFDHASRLTSSVQPENGTVNYYYTTAAGKLCSGNFKSICRRVDNRGITTTYGYDQLNRLTSKTYSDATHGIIYYYDQTSYNGLTISNPLGRRTGMSDGSGMTAWSYDATGRVLSLRRSINGYVYTAAYQYNLDGSVSNLTYFSGSQVGFTYSNAQRALSAIDPYPINFVTAAKYAPFGALMSAAFGAYNTGFTGITLTNSYSNRLQPVTLSAASPTMTVFSLSYNFNQGVSPAALNNGSVVTIQNNRDNTRTQTFTYDTLDRIASAQTTSSLWGNSYTIDRWGNLTNKNSIAGKAGESLHVTVNTKNQITGMTYDASGNVTSDGLGNTFTYDGENRLTAATGMNYIYDGDDNRVEKCTPVPSTSTTCANATSGTFYWRGADQSVINESDLTASTWKRFVFFNGKRVARRDSATGNVYYFFYDHLGSTGVVSDALGKTIINDSDYYPYGGERVVTNSLSDQSYKFTGKERDPESGLDNFGARYDASSLGRFMTPDPSNLSVDFWMPQTWNRYAYALNNPLAVVDRNGLWPWYVHKEIINEAFPGLSKSELLSLNTASGDVDKDQSPEGAYKHGLSNGDAVNTTTGPGETAYYIHQNQLTAEQIQADWVASGHTGIAPAAMTAFGNALHTVTDMTSPAHEGYQRWYGIRDFFGLTATYHFFRESHISVARKNAAVAAARQIFMNTFGWLALQNATDGLNPEVAHKICYIDENGMKSCQ